MHLMLLKAFRQSSSYTHEGQSNQVHLPKKELVDGRNHSTSQTQHALRGVYQAAHLVHSNLPNSYQGARESTPEYYARLKPASTNLCIGPYPILEHDRQSCTPAKQFPWPPLPKAATFFADGNTPAIWRQESKAYLCIVLLI